MKEKLLFVMPDSMEELLFASVVMSQYLISRMVMGRDVKEVTVVCKNIELHEYLKACWAWAEPVIEPTEEQKRGAELVFEFDAKRSYEVTKAVNKHIAEAFAIQLGVGMLRFLPPVLVEDRPEEIGTILVAERNRLDGIDDSWKWIHRENFIESLHEGGLPVTFLSSGAGWDEIRAAVGRASVVIGVRSSATTIAAAANRLVLELSPEEKGHRDWFRKKECGTYRMIYGKLQDMTPEFVWLQLAKLMEEAKGKRTKAAVAEVVNG